MPVELAENNLPITSKWLFPEYDFSLMDPATYESVIIERILDRGSWAEVNWLYAYYGESRLATWVSEHGFRLLSPRSFALWRLILRVEKYVAPDWAQKARNLGW